MSVSAKRKRYTEDEDNEMSGVAAAEEADSDSENEMIKHPLMLEDVLDNLFVYLAGNAKTLPHFRLVNKTWNIVACRFIKKNLRWKFGPLNKSKFLEVMSNSKDDLFRNFVVAHCHRNSSGDFDEDSSEDILYGAERFLKDFGDKIVDLQIKSSNPTFVKRYLGNTDLLPNLESLELYDMNQNVLATDDLLDGIKPFQKLTNLCINPRIFNEAHLEGFAEGEAKVVFNILNATQSRLKRLEINLPITSKKVLAEPDFLKNVTDFVTSHPDVNDNADDEAFAIVTLKSDDLKNLTNHCPKLKCLSTCLHSDKVLPQLDELLSKFKNQLEELDIGISDSNSTISSSSDEDEDSNSSGSESSELAHTPKPCLPCPWVSVSLYDIGKVIQEDNVNVREAREVHDKFDKHKPPAESRRIIFPYLPKLKKLILVDWNIYNNFHFFTTMPALEHIELRIHRCGLPVVPLATDYTNSKVKYLKYIAWPINFNDIVENEILEIFGRLFSNLKELDVDLFSNLALRTIFRLMTNLKRLHLNDSLSGIGITSCGITGISVETMEDLLQFSKTHQQPLINSDIKRDYQFIGDLKGLQHLTITCSGLTNLVVQFGIVCLKELTYLKLQPCRKTITPSGDTIVGPSNRRRSRLNLPRYFTVVEPVEVSLILEHCKNLVKLDVNDYLAQEEDPGDEDSDRSWNDSDSGSDNGEHEQRTSSFKGCGISDEELNLIRKHNPSLEIVFGEKKPFVEKNLSLPEGFIDDKYCTKLEFK